MHSKFVKHLIFPLHEKILGRDTYKFLDLLQKEQYLEKVPNRECGPGQQWRFLQKPMLEKFWNEHQSGLRNRSTELWIIMMLNLWQKNFE